MKNHTKKMAQLKYKDTILSMYDDKISVAQITKSINFRLARSKLKTTLSETTIRNLIKRYKNIK